MAKKVELTETQKVVLRSSYEKYLLTFGTRQKALEQVAKEFGLHWQTVRTLLKSIKPVDPKISSDVKKHQASKIDNIINSILEDLSLSRKELKGMSPAQSILAVAQLVDKAMKLKGEDVQKIEINEMGEKLQKKLEQLQNLKATLEKSIRLSDQPESN